MLQNSQTVPDGKITNYFEAHGECSTENDHNKNNNNNNNELNGILPCQQSSTDNQVQSMDYKQMLDDDDDDDFAMLDLDFWATNLPRIHLYSTKLQ